MNSSINRIARRNHWPLVTGSRSQKKRKVNALIRLGYIGAPNNIADEIKRGFQLKVALRPRTNRQRHGKTAATSVRPVDESGYYVTT